MTSIRLAAAALNQTPLAFAENTARIITVIEQAKKNQVKVLCFPELCISGYDCMDAFYSKDVQNDAWTQLEIIATHTIGIGVALGLPLYHEDHLYNAVAWVAEGKIEGFACKQILANQEVYYEARWFTPWPDNTLAHLLRGQRSYPIGKRLYEYHGVKIAFEICEEAWVLERIGIDMIASGAQIILNPSASHFSLDKLYRRRQLVGTLCQNAPIAYVYANQLGNTAGRLIYDGHLMLCCDQTLLEGPYLSFEQSTLVWVDYNPSNHQFFETNCAPSIITPSRNEQFAKAVTRGLWDLLKQTKTTGFVISLSGGVDSSACASLVWLMARWATQELGWKSIQEKLYHLQYLQTVKNVQDWIPTLLTVVYQKTDQNGPETENAARALASEMGATVHCVDIQPLFEQYQTMMAPLISTQPLSFETDDLILQNLQARVRSPSVWLIANAKNALLLSTSNRSECAVGYATMDGDTSGCFSPLAGIDKPFLQKWLPWMIEQGLPSLQTVVDLKPSAELRPLSSQQTDEIDLMPYPVLNAIEGQIRRIHCLDQQKILSFIIAKFPEYSTEQLSEWLDRFFLLWKKNQWKRERFAPSFQLDDYSLDPKGDARYPIFWGT